MLSIAVVPVAFEKACTRGSANRQKGKSTMAPRSADTAHCGVNMHLQYRDHLLLLD